MSARNYTACPKCELAERERQLVAASTAQTAYGKVPAAKYQKMIEGAGPRELQETLAEYYEWDVTADGRFWAQFHFVCSVCGFEFKKRFDVEPACTERSG